MTVKDYCRRIGDLVGKDDLKTAIQELHQMLRKSPHLDEAIIQSARYNDIMKQIRLGTVSFAAVDQRKNQIRLGILNLLAELEEQAVEQEQIRSEIETYSSSGSTLIRDSKNVIKDSSLSAGGNIIVGDHNINNQRDGDQQQ